MSNWHQRRDDARLELHIEEHMLSSLGLLDPGEPTRAAHYRYQRAERQRMEGPFTADERRQIRTVLGIGEVQP